MNAISRLSRRSADIPDTRTESWTFPCLRIEQGEGRVVYCFSVDGKSIHDFAAVSRIGRDSEGSLIGYQRPEVGKHIQAIRSYIDSTGSFIPNAVVLSFDDGVSFTPYEQTPNIGNITICLRKDGEKPGFIVDGQQRLAAIRASSRPSYQIFATAFIAKGDDEQRSQFVLVNNTKPLPKGLIHELLPEIHQCLPKSLGGKQIPAAIAVELNLLQRSPFHELINMPTNPNGIIAMASIQHMVGESLEHGLLRRSQTLDGVDIEKAIELLVDYWSVVRNVFSEAWALKPIDSRLMHGAGIYAMGALMDYLSVKLVRRKPNAVLSAMKPECAWTKGNWKMPKGKIPWDSIENVPQQKAELGKHLLRLADKHI